VVLWCCGIAMSCTACVPKPKALPVAFALAKPSSFYLAGDSHAFMMRLAL
jgi:hypothetical protein